MGTSILIATKDKNNQSMGVSYLEGEGFPGGGKDNELKKYLKTKRQPKP